MRGFGAGLGPFARDVSIFEALGESIGARGTDIAAIGIVIRGRALRRMAGDLRAGRQHEADCQHRPYPKLSRRHDIPLHPFGAALWLPPTFV